MKSYRHETVAGIFVLIGDGVGIGVVSDMHSEQSGSERVQQLHSDADQGSADAPRRLLERRSAPPHYR